MDKSVRRPSNSERKAILLDKFNNWLKSGDTVEEALDKFTPAQYDFLIDNGVDFDDMLLTTEQLETVKALTKAPRTVKNGYHKKYPIAKQNLYNSITELLRSKGATIIESEKCNFRDLDFNLDGVHYKIVLSNPRN